MSIGKKENVVDLSVKDLRRWEKIMFVFLVISYGLKVLVFSVCVRVRKREREGDDSFKHA